MKEEPWIMLFSKEEKHGKLKQTSASSSLSEKISPLIPTKEMSGENAIILLSFQVQKAIAVIFSAILHDNKFTILKILAILHLGFSNDVSNSHRCFEFIVFFLCSYKFVKVLYKSSLILRQSVISSTSGINSILADLREFNLSYSGAINFFKSFSRRGLHPRDFIAVRY